jgi:transposase
MRDTSLYQQILGLHEPWKVERVVLDEAAGTITVHVALPAGTRLPCPECGRADCAIKDRAERTWRHLDTCQFRTLLRAPLPRTDCPTCGVKTIVAPWALKGSRFTLLFERLAIDALQEMSVEGASRLLGLTWEEAAGIMDRAVARGLERRDVSSLRRIGIDEKAVLKGHRYITMDMWAPYRASCRKWVVDADAKTVLDRFHIERYLNAAVDDVRRAEQRMLKSYGIDTLDRTRWDWLYHPENLPPERLADFEELRDSDLRTARAYALKENFRHFWDYKRAGNARRFFEDWFAWAMGSALEPVKKVARMFERHFDRILTYFRHRATNATAEGLNNKIQTIKKKAYGFRNVDRFINATYFHGAGLRLHPQ